MAVADTAKWPRWRRPSGRGGDGRIAAAGTAKWPRRGRPSGRGGDGRVAAADTAKWPPRSARPLDCPPMTRVLSGIQPTGKKHLGNYIGAIRHYVADQYEADA